MKKPGAGQKRTGSATLLGLIVSFLSVKFSGTWGKRKGKSRSVAEPEPVTVHFGWSQSRCEGPAPP